MFGARCVRKEKTPKAAKSLSPHFQYQTTFNLTEVGGYDAIQAIVWADYGPMDNKAFMGVAQVQVIYKQFLPHFFKQLFKIFFSIPTFDTFFS